MKRNHLINLVILVLVKSAAYISSHSIDNLEPTAFNDFLSRFGRIDELQPSDIDNITSKLFGSFNCKSNSSLDCDNCLKSGKFQEQGIFGATIDSFQFNNVSIILLCYLTNLPRLCTVGSTIDSGKCYNQLTSGSNKLSENGLEDLLTGYLKPIYQPNTKLNYSNGYESVKCIDSHELIHKYSHHHDIVLNQSSQSNYIFSEIISSLYGDAPIDNCKLPYPTWFIQKLYSDYSNGNENVNIEGIQKLISDMSLITNDDHDHDHSHDHDHDHSHDHDHRKKRRSLISRNKRSITDDNFNQCYSAQDLLSIYEVSNSSIKISEFESILPSLVYMDVNKVCKRSPPERTKNTAHEKYGFGTIAVFLVSILSILGIVLLPCLKMKNYEKILCALAALAASTLLSDATLHLVPAALGIHDHSSHSSGKVEIPSYTYKLCIFLAAIYAFWVLEILMNKFGGDGHTHSHEHIHGIAVKPAGSDTPYGVNSTANNSTKTLYDTEANIPAKNGVETTNEKQIKRRFCDLKGIKLTGWMILFGDGIHNFADGLAIGASFAESNSLGISTTIAIVCHEIPHEFGDYAVLIKCGFTHIQALVLNFLSACTCFGGFYIGASVGSNEEVSRWIFAITAGMFFYIALVNLLPEMFIGRIWTWKYFLSVNFFLWLGFILMFLLTVFEGKISI